MLVATSSLVMLNLTWHGYTGKNVTTFHYQAVCLHPLDRPSKYILVFFQDVSVGGSTCGRANMKLIRTLLDELAGEPFVGRTVDVLGDTVSSQKTPVRFPSLLSKFRCVC